MKSIRHSVSLIKRHIQIIFWRLSAFLIDYAVRHRESLQGLLPLVPLLWYGSAAYIAGLIIGELIKVFIL